MITPKLSLQLYTLREQMKDADQAATAIAEVARIGYAGVECGGFYGLTPRAFRRLVEDNGMVVSSSWGDLPTEDTIGRAVEVHGELGTNFRVCGFWIDDFKDRDAIARTADRLNPAIALLKREGITLCVHNHWMEFERIDGVPKYDLLAERCPDLALEIDVYWGSNFGAERPAEMVRRYASRAPLLHCKDGPFTRDEPMVACGAGAQDFPSIFAAADPDRLRWAIVELDHCATDMMRAVADSHRYLTGAGFARGRT